MTSAVGHCNIALGKLGAQPIIDLLDDTRNGRAMNRVYEAYRDMELRSHPWTFAMARAQIPALTPVPAFGWQRAFPRPAQCLRLVEVGEDFIMYTDEEPAFALEGNNILCNEASPLNIRYIQRITNTGLWDPSFSDVFACRLAFETCKEITGSTDMRQQLWGERQAALAEARRMNAIEKPPVRPVRGSWWLALHGQGG